METSAVEEVSVMKPSILTSSRFTLNRAVDDLERRAFNFGVAYSVAELLRRDMPVQAEEIWEASGAKLVGAARYDTRAIQAAIKKDWGRKA